MDNRQGNLKKFAELTLLWIVLGVLLVYTYAKIL